MRQSALDIILPYADRCAIAIDREAHVANPGSAYIRAETTEADRQFASQVEAYCEQHLELCFANAKMLSGDAKATVLALRTISYMLDHSLTVLRQILRHRCWALHSAIHQCRRLSRGGYIHIGSMNRKAHIDRIYANGSDYADMEYYDHELLGVSACCSLAELEYDLAGLKIALEFGQYLDVGINMPEHRTVLLIGEWVQKNGYGTVTVYGSSVQAIEIIEIECRAVFGRCLEQVIFHGERDIRL